MEKKEASLALWCAAVMLASAEFCISAPANESSAPSTPRGPANGFRINHLEYTADGRLTVPAPGSQIPTFFYGEMVTNLTVTSEFSGFSNDSRHSSGPPARPAPRYQIDRWNTLNGLPANKIRSLLQTRDGYLWIGNVTALTRFDGARFTVFDETNSAELKGHESIGRCLYEDEQGRLWIGTEGGLLCREGGRFVSFSGQQEMRGEVLNAFTRRAAGGFWIGADRGLAYWDRDGVQWIEIPGVSRVLSLAEAANGTLWIGTGVGALVAFDTRVGEIIRTLRIEEFEPEVVSLAFQGLWLDRRQRLWIGSTYRVFRLDAPDAEPIAVEQPVRIHGGRFAEDAPGAIWAANGSEYGRGLGSLTRFTEEAGGTLATSVGPGLGPVSCVLADREGAIWAGGRDGLTRVRAQSFATMAIGGVGGAGLYSIALDQEGSLWMGNTHYLGRWSGNELTVLDTKWLFSLQDRPLRSPLVIAGFFGRNWANHSLGGLFPLPVSRSDLETAATLPFARHFAAVGGDVGAMLRSRRGDLWIGTSNALFRVTSLGEVEHWSSAFTRPAPPEGGTSNAPFSFPSVHALVEDGQTNLWIGTDAGLFQLDPAGRVHSFTNRVGSGEIRVIAIHADSNNGLWLGTQSGLRHFANEQFAAFDPESGLPQQAIQGILEDDSGRLWVGCNAGVIRVARTELETWLQDRSRQPAVAVYGPADGILALRGRRGSQVCAKGSDGRLWFAKESSLVVVDPDECPTAPPPRVFIESVTADRKALDLAALRSAAFQASSNADRVRFEPENMSLKLPKGGGRHLEFHFTTTSLRSPERVLLRYRLEGHDADWREAGSARRATYTNLRPGRYQFRVRARNHEGRWSERDAALTLRLPAYFWQTWPFYLSCSFALTGSVSGFVAWRLRRQRRRLEAQRLMALERERERIARDMHDSLGARLTELAFSVGQDQAAGQKVRASLQELRDAVWAVNPRNDSSAELAGFIADYASRCLPPAGLDLELDLPPASSQFPIPGPVRHEIAALFKEALRNVLQHARARRIRIQMRADERELSLSVHDDGCGFDSATAAGTRGGGNGLRNFHTRCANLDGSCRIDSTAGHGTRVEFIIPLKSEISEKPKYWFRRGT